jgi:hypothetical protein
MRGRGIRHSVCVAFAGGVPLACAGLLAAQPATCTKAEFEAVVEGAAGALRELNQKNRPAFQDKLRELKDKRGWSTEQFMAEAAPFVQDEKIADFDQTSGELLGRINSAGEGGGNAPDCNLLASLRASMKQLVATQTAKWSYMFLKLDAALKKR